MKKEDYRQWLSERVATQIRLVTTAAVIMGMVGLVAIVLEAVVIKWIAATGFVSSNAMAWLVTLGILSSILFVTWLRTPKNLGDMTYPGEIGGEEIAIRVAPAMGTVWTFALGSIDSDRTWVERLLGLLAMPQRLLCAAWYAMERVKQLQELDISECATVFRVLFRKAERVEVSEIAEKRTFADLPRTLRDVSLIDGVVFLTRRTVGISLASRLVDQLNAWKSGRDAMDEVDD